MEIYDYCVSVRTSPTSGIPKWTTIEPIHIFCAVTAMKKQGLVTAPRKIY